MQQRTRPALMVVGGLLLAALVAALVLWSAIGNDDGSPGVTTTPSSPAVVVTTLPAQASGGPVPVTVIGAAAYDPDGDGQENDALVPNVLDGDPDTTWRTVCYQSQYLGGKGGVGVVLELSTPAVATVDVDLATGPWSAEIHAAADAMPTSIEGWGAAVASDYGTDPDTFTATTGTAARYVLVLLRELAPDDDCSADNPYRGRISEIRITPAP